MKITIIIFLLSVVFGIENTNMVSKRGTGMTPSAIRTYFRHKKAAAMARRRNIDIILNQYFNRMNKS